MESGRISVLNVLGIAAISTIGVRLANFAWDKFVEPKINKVK